MSDNVESLLPWLGIGLALYLLGIPALIYCTLKLKAQPSFTRFDPNQSRPPGEAGRYFAAMDEELRRLGFQWRDSLTLSDVTPQARALVSIYANTATLDLAMVTLAYGLDPGTQHVAIKSSYTEFIARFRDGNLRVLNTNNNRIVGAFPQTSGARTFRFPHIEDVERLLTLHTRLQEREQSPGKKYLRLDDEFAGDCVQYMQTVFLEEYERQVGTNYLYYSPADASYRPTLKGGFLMSWKEMWPFKTILIAGMRAQAKRLELEIR